jgi:hypothetical protein
MTMGSCLSIPDAPVAYSNPEMRVASEVIRQLGVLNSAVTKETMLMEGCKNTATDLLEAISGKANSFEDILKLTLVTEQLDVIINVLKPVKQTVMELVSAATNERREFETRFRARQPPNRTLDGVRVIQSAANSLTPDLYSTVQASARIRNTADAVVNVLEERYSDY